MNVKFIAVNSDALDTVPIINGQIITLIDMPGYFYDMLDERRRIISSVNSETLPATGYKDTVYAVTVGDSNYSAGLYIWDETNQKWVGLAVNKIKGEAETSFRSGDVIIKKSDIGLGHVEDKSAAEILATMTPAQISAALGSDPLSKDMVGVKNGIAGLDKDGLVPLSQLPVFYNALQVEETFDDLPPAGVEGRLYTTTDNHNYYQWDGEKFTGVSSGAMCKKYTNVYAEDSGDEFTNQYFLEVRRLDATQPARVTIAISALGANTTAITSNVVATVDIGTDLNSIEYIDAIVEQPAADDVKAVTKLCSLGITRIGKLYESPQLIGFHTEKTQLTALNVNACVLFTTNCYVKFRNALIRQGALNADRYVEDPTVLDANTTGHYQHSGAPIAQNSRISVTSGDLYTAFGGPLQTAAKVVTTSTGSIDKTDLQAVLNALGAVDAIKLAASGWSSTAPYTQTVNLARMTEASRPSIGIAPPDVESSANYKQQAKAYGFINKFETHNGTITFECWVKKPTVDINILVKGV